MIFETFIYRWLLMCDVDFTRNLKLLRCVANRSISVQLHTDSLRSLVFFVEIIGKFFSGICELGTGIFPSYLYVIS